MVIVSPEESDRPYLPGTSIELLDPGLRPGTRSLPPAASGRGTAEWMMLILHGPTGIGAVSYAPSVMAAEKTSLFPTSDSKVISPDGSGLPLTVIVPLTVPTDGLQLADKRAARATT